MRTLISVCLLALLSGCADLNVSWVATATYNTPASTQTILNPGATIGAAK